MNVHVEVIDNSELIKNATDAQIEAALTACGLQAEGYAKSNLTAAGRRGEGILINSVTNTVRVEKDRATAYVGTDVEYAVYHEVGTGIYTEGGGGRQTPWSYKDRHGEWHTPRGLKPTHFLKNAIADHVEEYKAIIESHLKG